VEDACSSIVARTWEVLTVATDGSVGSMSTIDSLGLKPWWTICDSTAN